MPPVQVLLCSFSPVTGWRVRGISQSDYWRPSVVKIGELKLLKIPSLSPIKPGYFCNPKKISIDYVRNRDH